MASRSKSDGSRAWRGVTSFGCVLFEMLTGRRVFDGDDVTDFIVSVLTKEPDWTQLPASTPPADRRAAGALPQEGSTRTPARHRRRAARSGRMRSVARSVVWQMNVNGARRATRTRRTDDGGRNRCGRRYRMGGKRVHPADRVRIADPKRTVDAQDDPSAVFCAPRVGDGVWGIPDDGKRPGA